MIFNGMLFLLSLLIAISSLTTAMGDMLTGRRFPSKAQQLENSMKHSNSTLDRDFIPAWKKIKNARNILITNRHHANADKIKDNATVKNVYRKDWIYNLRPNLLKSPLRKQNDLIHKAVSRFLKSLTGKKFMYGKPKRKNYYTLKKHLIPLTTENDILLSKKAISMTRYPFSKYEPDELTILKHATLDEIVNKAVDQVVAQIQSRKHKLHQIRTNSSDHISDPSIKRTSMNSTHNKNPIGLHSKEEDILMLSKVVENEVVKKLENDSDLKLFKNTSGEKENDLVNTLQNTTKKHHENSPVELLNSNVKNKNVTAQSLDKNKSANSTNKNSTISTNKNTTISQEAFVDPFENVDSENASVLENDITKSAIEKAAFNNTLPTIEGEERMAYDIKDFYAAPNVDDTDSRDKIARLKSKALNLKSSTHLKKHKLHSKTKVNDVIKAFYNGGFNFLDGKGGFSDNEDSFRTKESEDETRVLMNGVDKSLILDNKSLKIFDAKTSGNDVKTGNQKKCIENGSIKGKLKSQNRLLQHKDYIEGVNDDPPSFDEINIDEKNLHLEAKIDSIESREKVMKDLIDVIKILRNLQPLHPESDEEINESPSEESEPTDTRLQPVYPESVLDLQSDRPSPSTYTVTLNGNVYKLEKLNKETNNLQANEDVTNKNKSGAPTTLILNIKTTQPNASYDFERIYSAVDSKAKFKPKEPAKILMDPMDGASITNIGNCTQATAPCKDEAKVLPTSNNVNDPELEIESIENKSKNNRTAFIVHNKHHKTFKIEEIREDDKSPSDAKENVKNMKDVFEIRHNNKVFRVIELNGDSPECCEKKKEEEVKLAKPCKPAQEKLCKLVSQDKPCVSDSQDKPCVSDSQDKPCKPISQDTPCTSDCQDKPCASDSQDKPCKLISQDKPCVSIFQDKPCASDSQDKPCTSESEDKPCPSVSQDKPCVNTQEKPCASDSQDEPCVSTSQKKPCTPIHDDDIKKTVAMKPQSDDSDVTDRKTNENVDVIKEFSGKTIHVAYKSPAKSIDTVREEVAKEASKDNDIDVIKILPLTSLFSNSSKTTNENNDSPLMNATDHAVIFQDDELTKVNETDQLDKMSAMKNEPVVESSGLFRDRIEKSSDDNYDTFIFQIPRKKDMKTDNIDQSEGSGMHDSIKKSLNPSNRFINHEVRNLKGNEVIDNDLQKTLDEQVVP